MLEGAVARLLNHLLGKYVVDLDTENLNVGIFSGHVQLTDLKLKTEALYELGLPIEVKAGTIGKIWLQIPWTSLWSQPVVVNIEDLHIVSGPLLTNETFDADKNKRLIRAFKRKLLANLDTESHIIGGPNSFSEHLVTNILNSLQFTVTNVHIRYEDLVSYKTPISAGLCIGSITAETTNSKWKASKVESNSNNCYYLIKIETLSTYWNHDSKVTKWNLPSEYYMWRNAMSNSLQNFSMNDETFNFVLKPMTTKIKITMNKSNAGNILKCLTDVIVQDCNIQLCKEQYDSILAVNDSLKRVLVSWEFLSSRPKQTILENKRAWWKYAYLAVLEQRVRPYTWERIKKTRECYRGYMQTYKQIILNPNDTELKLDLQKYEDNLSIVNIVIARQHARLLVQSRSLSEKNFWSMLPSPERTLLCKKIGFYDKNCDHLHIDQQYNLRMGNISLSLTNNSKEIVLLTLTQTNLSFHPNNFDCSYKSVIKVEGVIMEGSNEDEQLMSIIASEHLSTSPAYILKADFEKMPTGSKCSHRLNVTLDSIECLYNQQFCEDIMTYLDNEFLPRASLSNLLREWPNIIRGLIDSKLSKKWDMTLNVKIPFFVIPEFGSFLKADNILVVDLGRYFVTTELCQTADLIENATQMEMEEQFYSKLHIECNDMQVLFCQNSDNWKDERKEKDTDLHIVPKNSFSAVYARSSRLEKSIPKYKFNLNFHSLKINMSERKSGQILKFFSNNGNYLDVTRIYFKPDLTFDKDIVINYLGSKYLADVEALVSITDNFIKIKRGKIDKSQTTKIEKSNNNTKKEDMNEAWARYVDLPGLEDNISPNNNIIILLRFIINEFTVVFSRSSDSTDRQYLMFRLGLLTADIALMTFGPAYQVSINSILLTDKLHTTPSGQYLDLIYSPFPCTVDVITVLYRKVSAGCPDFWSHFHGVETSLVADFGTIHLLLHQEAIHTLVKYSNYLFNKLKLQTPISLRDTTLKVMKFINNLLHQQPLTPVPPGSIKFSHSARLADINVRVCDSDFDIVNIQLSGLEMDFLFRANERFVFRSYLSNINVEHLSEITLYTKVLSTDEDKVFELKYVRQASHIQKNDITNRDETLTGGSFKFQLGQIHLTLLYKLIVQIQRFVMNLEALPYINRIIEYLYNAVTTVTDTLKANTRIHLAINVCGPVLLFPQKSSSPNVMIIDTGDLYVENFFKEYSNDIMENILLKWTGMTVTRGVMTLVPSLEMQETLIEPINVNFDIKRYTNIKSAQKFWDIDGALDCILITLGQRDISTILSIYKDNIGEGKIIDLFPDQIKAQRCAAITDETVKTLEAFFCEPKQKNIVAKFSLDEVTLSLFFDSGELLSSPIRDLNHGLCKLKISDVSTTFTIYTDGSLDGKLSADGVLVEEIGPDANIYDKGILQSPIDDNKNNNCNITINRAPIIDVTFHQNKAGDKSADVIIGRLSLSLSVPFCEKIALFVLECLPKDNLDSGIVNHGYECDNQQSDIETKEYSASLTISLRINKPEFIFVVETTSNKKRYFITHTEILSDYSRHGNRLNLVVSLSGLHSLFYDIGVHSNEPYVILKQCDVEFSKCYSEEKGKKIIASVSSIYVQICSRVVHSLTDILNDITEHFKVPEVENKTHCRTSSKSECDDLWEPKKIDEFASQNSDFRCEEKIIAKGIDVHEILLIPKFDIVVIFELEETQVLLIKSTMEVTIYDWSSLLNCTCEFTIQANYFNENLQAWEPVIDPVVIDEKEYKPWDVLIKIFQDKSLPMLGVVDHKSKNHSGEKKKNTPTTTEDEDSGEDMMYLEPINPLHNRNNRRVKTSLSTFLDDSDSENEDGAMEKLAAAISDLFTGDWNESEDSDYIHSSEGEDESDDNIKPKTQEDKTQPFTNYTKSTYILIDAKEVLNVSVTPTLLRVLSELLTIYSNKTLSVVTNKKSINLINDIGPQSKVELYEKKNDENGEDDTLVYVKPFENQDSAPSSPNKSVYYSVDFNEDINEDKDSTQEDTAKNELESNYDFVTMSSLHFPSESTSHLYEKINNHFIKVFIPNCSPIQTNCSRKSWQKLMKLQCTVPGQKYYLAAKHTISKCGRKLVISSPLQIKNETCFALSVLYQPSVLQQLNLEPVGDVTNPFETTMRIAVLEAHESYNVPLYIAYHCKLFIQPAYAEGHYTSDSGIWWKDLATELDIAHNLHCRPRSDSNLEVFSLRVMLTKNLDIPNSQAHSVPNYIIHLLPPLILHNYLPYSLEVENVMLKQHIKIEPGEKKSVYSLDLSKDQKLLIKVKYNLLTWSGILNFTTYLDEKIVILSSDSKEVKHLAINTKTDREGSCNIFFYTPYWIINKIGLPLQIKASATNTVYESNNEDILLFTYKRHGKQTLNVKVYDSNWSNEFGLECAGTTGLIICKDNERKKKYLFFLSIKLSQMCPRLTKIVTLLPSFLVTNCTHRNLRFMEHNEKTDLWIDIGTNQTVTFWPETSSMQMYVKYRDSKLISQAFNFATPNSTVLRMDKGGALKVEITGGISDSFRITFHEYTYGDAPILVKNYCPDLFLKIQQQEQSQVTLLSPYNSLLYTWDDPTKIRKLVWNVYNNKGTGFLIDIFKDAYGEEKILFHSVTPTTSMHISSSSDDSDSSDSVKTTMNKKVRRDKIVIYWLCYAEGLQRVLLFTQESRIFNAVLSSYFLEHCDIECLVSLCGVGVSLFTSENSKKEHVYASVVDTPAIWEVNVGHKWKTLTLELASWIEDKYRLHYKKCQLRDYIHIDFEKMYMLKPFFAELKRTYTPAIYFQFRKSKNYHYFNFKLNTLQVDNKVSNTIVLYPLPTSVVKGLNSFIDLNVLKCSTKDCDIYRHIKINIKDFYLNIENDLFVDIRELIMYYKKFCDEATVSYDLRNGRSVIEYVSISNFEIQLHISNKTQISLNCNNLPLCKVLNYLFPINISPYMPLEGVLHKVSAIEQAYLCEHLETTLSNLLQQIISQFLQQYYSHVLGLQVLVNTFAIQPAIMYPQLDLEKMANTLLYGSRCLLSHINMSPAALEQCVIDIFANQTFENIQRIRRHGSYQKSEVVPKIITASCRNFHSGVPNALNQLIVRKQNAGINCDGEMFFRTTGKALYSLITRHPDDKSNSVEVAKEALRRASILGEPIRIQQRLTRYYNRYLGLKPFSVYESMGQNLLETVGNCRFMSDTYWSHAAIDRVGKSILLVSLQHVIRINKCRLWGPWDVEWAIDLDDIISMPKITSTELVFNMRQSENNTREILLKISGDKEMLTWIHEKIEQAIIVSMEDKSWTVTENP
ncbi:intermembrane lipid transfer protein VPS13C-like isoform X2 [Zophobas morio]|uniref:intermembrane lipid transfer protein VPS13C-like isoform X2 n=1 Tax=Zophobas morio TaxID=2755281 RepID=UPI00308383DA